MKYFTPIFLFLFGTIFSIIGSIIFIPSFNIINNGILVQGKVTDLNESRDSDGHTMYSPVVEYNCDGVNIKNSTNISSSSTYNIGEIIGVYCLKNNPKEFVIDSFMYKYFGLIFIIIGFIPIIISISIILYAIKRKKLIEYLKNNGKILNLKVESVGQNNLYQVNGSSPYFITSQYLDKDTNKLYIFKSENIWFNIDNFVKIGDSINVYVMENDYKKYYVDISFLPKT